MTQRNLDDAIAHLRATARIWSDRQMYGEFGIRLRFVNGVGVLWEAAHNEVHKSGQETT